MIVNTFKNKIFPLKKPARFPEYVSEEHIPSRSSSSEGAIAANPRSSSPEGAIVAIPRNSSPAGAIGASPRRSSLNNNEIMTESENIDPEIIRYYFGFDSFKKYINF